jgi:hypothetical protein
MFFKPLKPVVLDLKLMQTKDRTAYSKLTYIIEIKNNAINVLGCKINPVLKDQFFRIFFKWDQKGAIIICLISLKRN